MTGSQFPGFVPLQFAQGGGLADALKGAGANLAPLAKAAGGTMNAPQIGGPVPGAQGPTSVGGPGGPQPLAPPTLMDALKNMSPAQIMASLGRVAQPQAPGMPPGGQMAMPGAQGPMMPGSALFQQAGMGPSGAGGY